MKPELPNNEREQQETKITALLLGELNAEEAAALRKAIAENAALAKLHERLRLTMELVRETSATPAGELAKQPAPLRLSPARRAALLAHFKTVPMPEAKPPEVVRLVFLVKLAAALAILLVVAGIALPKLAGRAAKAKTQNSSPLETLKVVAIEGADTVAVNGWSPRTGNANPAGTKPGINAANAHPAATPTVAIPIYMGKTEESAVNGMNFGAANNGPTLNLRGVSVDKALEYLADSEGLTINRQANTQLGGTVDLVSEKPLTKDEKVAVFNKVLADHGLTAVQDKNVLTIESLDGAFGSAGNPVNIVSAVSGIPANDQVVTDIIPVHSLNPTQVAKDLQTLLPKGAEMTTSEAGNAIIMTGHQDDIKRMAQTIGALDTNGPADVDVFYSNTPIPKPLRLN